MSLNSADSLNPAYTFSEFTSGISGAVPERTSSSLYISDDLLNQASPEFGIENNADILFSICSSLFSI